MSKRAELSIQGFVEKAIILTEEQAKAAKNIMAFGKAVGSAEKTYNQFDRAGKAAITHMGTKLIGSLKEMGFSLVDFVRVIDKDLRPAAKGVGTQLKDFSKGLSKIDLTDNQKSFDQNVKLANELNTDFEILRDKGSFLAKALEEGGILAGELNPFFGIMKDSAKEFAEAIELTDIPLGGAPLVPKESPEAEQARLEKMGAVPFVEPPKELPESLKKIGGGFKKLGKATGKKALKGVTNFGKGIGNIVGQSAKFGLMFNLADTFGQLINAINPFQPLLEGLTEVFGVFGDLISAEVAPVMADFFETMLSEENMALFTELGGAFAELLGEIIPFIPLIIQALVPAFMELTKAIIPLIPVFLNALVPILTDVVVPLIRLLAAALIALKPVFDVIMPLIGGLAVGLGILIDALRIYVIPAFTFVGNVFVWLGEMIWWGIQGLGAIIAGAINAVVAVINTTVAIVTLGLVREALGTVPVPAAGAFPTFPSFAIGTDFVTRTGVALIHRGEEIRNAEAVGGGFTGGGEIHNHYHIENMFAERREVDRMFEEAAQRIFTQKLTGSRYR